MPKIEIESGYVFNTPKPPESNSEIIGHDLSRRSQYWVRGGYPENWDSMEDFEKVNWVIKETDRCFNTGVWIYINGVKHWIPPAYYFFLTWFKVPAHEDYSPDGYCQFRLPQLYLEYFILLCEEDKHCIGTFRWKGRRTGETTYSVARMLWKALKTINGYFGIQSKTFDSAKNPCFSILTYGLESLPDFLIPNPTYIYQTKIIFGEKARGDINNNKRRDDIYVIKGTNYLPLNTHIEVKSTSEKGFDGKEADEIIIDEYGKWYEESNCSAESAFQQYVKTMTRGSKKKGLIHCFTSPPINFGVDYSNCIDAWNSGDYDALLEVKGWKRYRYFTPTNKNREGCFDKYGYPLVDIADEAINNEIASKPKSQKIFAIRENARTISDIIATTSGCVFLNADDLLERSNFLKSIDKIPGKADPKYVYGNFYWVNGVRFGDVGFRPSVNQSEFSDTGRFAVHKLRKSKEKVRVTARGKYSPQSDSEFVIGFDPFNVRVTAKTTTPSSGGLVCIKAFDFYNDGDEMLMHFIYKWRAEIQDYMYEDTIMASFYYGAYIHAETRDTRFVDYCEDNGLADFLIPRKVSTTKDLSTLKGEATGTKTLSRDIIPLIEAYNYDNLDNIWFEQVLDDNLTLDPEDTHKSDLSMAEGMALIGVAKRKRQYRMRRSHDLSGVGEAIRSLF